MGRRPTKASDNPFCQARMAAAKYDERLYSKEVAADLIGVHVSSLSDYELGYTKVVPPDKVALMADLYKAPELINYYCREVCPLGWDMPKLEIEDLDRITIKALSALRKIDKAKESLLDITEDGRITEEEQPELKNILNTLDEVTAIAQSLKAWVEKNLN